MEKKDARERERARMHSARKSSGLALHNSQRTHTYIYAQTHTSSPQVPNAERERTMKIEQDYTVDSTGK